MEVQVYPQTRTALKENLTLRCLLRAKFPRDASRRSADVISWAQSLVESLSSAVLREVEQQTSGFSIQMNVIQMLGVRNLVYIFYDLFLDECDERLRAEIAEDFHTKRPVHLITQKGKVYIMRRDERKDKEVAEDYLYFRKIDKGPRPFRRREDWELPDWIKERVRAAHKKRESREQDRPAASEDRDERRDCQEEPEGR